MLQIKWMYSALWYLILLGLMESINSYIDAFGIKLVALLFIVFLLYLLLMAFPIIWPALRAFRSKNRLPRPWLFTGVVAGLSYGIFNLLIALLLLPIEAYLVFIAPQIRNSGHHELVWVDTTGQFITDWWWILLGPLLAFFAVLVTKFLSVKWSNICLAINK